MDEEKWIIAYIVADTDGHKTTLYTHVYASDVHDVILTLYSISSIPMHTVVAIYSAQFISTE